MKKLLLHNNEGGVALLMALGILVMLSILGAAFAATMRLGERTTREFINGIKVDYLAEAGIQYAIGQLKYNSTDGPLAKATDDVNEGWYTAGTNPSYSDTTLLPNSGYSVKVYDCASRINISDNNTNSDNNSKSNMAEILKNLDAILNSPLDDTDCDNIMAAATTYKYKTKEEVKRALSGTAETKDDKYNAIRAYITAYGYIDQDVINPRDITDPVYSTQPRAPINVNTASQEVLRAVLTGVRAINACPRCGGDGTIFRQSGSSPTCTACGGTGDLEISSTPTNEVNAIASYIASYRQGVNGPFKSWSQLYQALRNNYLTIGIGLKDADLVLANANPNTGFSWVRNLGWGEKLGRVGKYVIDYNKSGVPGDTVSPSLEDKGLTTSTTEFSFNSGGYYEIESTGQLRASGGTTIIAQKRIGAVVQVMDILRDTTQADFDAGTKSNIQSYPEPILAGVSSATYDGQIMLSKQNSAAGPIFLANYKTTVSADSAAGSATPMANTGAPNVASIALNSTGRGDLLPDGLLVDNFGPVHPKYSPKDNVTSYEGTLEIWFKSMYNASTGNCDTRIFGDTDSDRKLFRFTSLSNKSGGAFLPSFALFLWSDLGNLWQCLIMETEYWSLADQVWYKYPGTPEWWKPAGGGVFGNWDAGKWNQLALTWSIPKGPVHDDPELGPGTIYYSRGNPEGTYNKDTAGGTNSLWVYFNGASKAELYYDFHTQYENLDETRAMMLGGEYSNWQTPTPFTEECSNSIIGKVRVWNTKRSGNQIQADYNDGLYGTGGTASGIFTSATLTPQGGGTAEWGTLTWTEAIPDGISGDITVNGQSNPEANNIIGGTTNSITYTAVLSASGTLLIDTPVLEDVTITYLPRTRVRYWRKGID